MAAKGGGGGFRRLFPEVGVQNINKMNFWY